MSSQANHSAAAIAWHIRLREADASGWEEFTAWLEADAEHLRAFEEVAAVDDELGSLVQPRPRPVAVASDTARWSFGRRATLGWAVAAALVGVIGYTNLGGGETAYVERTAPGERRSLALRDGSKVHINGSSIVRLDRSEPRFAKVEQGEALFSVVHDPGNPFRVEAGSAVIRNVGTVFNVVSEGEQVLVEVAEGAVLFKAGGREVGLSAGMTARETSGVISVGRREASDIGGWRTGELAYSSASYARVVRDLSRSTGLKLSVSPELAERRFSGVIVLDPDRGRLVRRLGALLDAQVRPSGDEWIVAATDS